MPNICMCIYVCVCVNMYIIILWIKKKIDCHKNYRIKHGILKIFFDFNVIAKNTYLAHDKVLTLPKISTLRNDMHFFNVENGA